MTKKIDVVSVDSGVPIPEDTKSRYPWTTLEIGDSFVFPISKRNSVASSATRYSKRTGVEFTVKRIDKENGRIWRIK